MSVGTCLWMGFINDPLGRPVLLSNDKGGRGPMIADAIFDAM